MSRSPASAEFPAWGGRAVVVATDPDRLDAAVAAVQQVIAEVDAACSSFREDSELMAVNAAGGAPVPASERLLVHVEAALRAARVTDGDVDPTVGEALVAFGFAGAAETAPRSRPVIRRVAGYEVVRVDRAARTLTVPGGVRLDLGATAKALAADQAAGAAFAAAGCGVLVSLSGDLSIAGPEPLGGWRVRVTDDHRSATDVPGQWISLSGGGLATSSTTVRRSEGAHHVIDPRTGLPAEVHFRTVSVAAGTCLDANIASTAAIVRGARAAQWLEALGLPGRLVRLDGTVVHVAGWPSEGEDLPHALANPIGSAA